VEGLCLGLFGAVAGTVIGTLIILIINLSNITFSFGQQTGLLLKTSLLPNDILVTCVIVVVVSVLATLQPAIRASRMRPIDALRHV
jgi:putative ABC transport system permease protein